MKIGYARVSAEEQNLALQNTHWKPLVVKSSLKTRALRSGAGSHRVGKRAHKIGAGDVLVVWRLDRLGRSLAHLIEIIDAIGKAGGGFVSLSESIDTTTAGGRLVFHIMGTHCGA